MRPSLLKGVAAGPFGHEGVCIYAWNEYLKGIPPAPTDRPTLTRSRPHLSDGGEADVPSYASYWDTISILGLRPTYRGPL